MRMHASYNKAVSTRPIPRSAIIGLFITVTVGLVCGTMLLNRFQHRAHLAEAVQIRLKWVHQSQFAGFYVAQQKGFFQTRGLSVTLNPGGVDFPAIQEVASGGEEFGVTGADQILLARDKGAPVVAVAVIYRISPMVLFSLGKSTIRTPKDLESKRVGVKLGGNAELTYRALIRTTGINAHLIREIPVRYDMTPLFTGQVDVWPGYLTNEVIVAEEQGYEVTIIRPADYGIELYGDTLFTTEKMIAEHPETVKEVVQATLMGWQYAVDHPDEAIDATLRYSDKLNRDHEAKMLHTSISLIKPDATPIGWMDVEKWTAMERLLRAQHFLSADIDITKLFTNKFIDVPNK